VDVLGHDDLAKDGEAITSADGLQSRLEQSRGRGTCEVLQAVVTTECEKVQAATLLVTMQSARHDESG
jgi:hypothetical protein